MSICHIFFVGIPIAHSSTSSQTFFRAPSLNSDNGAKMNSVKMPESASAVQSGPSFGNGDTMNYKGWVAKAPKQPMVLETVDLGPLGAEEVEVVVENCGLCHSDLSVLNNDWGISRYPAILGHEVIGRVTAVGPNTKGIKVGQRVGIGWNSASCMHCRQCMSG